MAQRILFHSVAIFLGSLSGWYVAEGVRWLLAR